jgi:hypothetical protein
MGLIRHGLTVAGGVLVTQGYADVAQVETLVGAGVIVIGIAWSVWAKWSA